MTLLSRLVFFPKKKTLISSGRIITNEISLVLPVKDNQKGVNHYLDTLFSTYKPCDFPKEVIIVDNNSVPAIKICDHHLQQGLTIKLLLCNNPGPASARNLGAQHSTGNWILFNDSDCLPTKTLLSGYVQADNGSVAYAGNIKSFGSDLLSKYYESQEILLPLKTQNSETQFVPQYLITANSLVWREAFVQVNGFNENIKIAGGEDVDLGLRLSEVGELSYAFESIALHKFDDGIVGFYKRFIRYGQGNRIVEELWQTKMKPNRFRPNISTPFNEIVAVFQFLFLSIGYYEQTKKYNKQILRKSLRPINNGRQTKNKNQMSKKLNHQADIKNPNKGTSGTNTTYEKNQGNRGKQLNTIQPKKGK